MKVLIFGGTGMLGHKLVQVLGKKFDVFATIRGNFASVERFHLFERSKILEGIDVTDFESVASAVESVKPEVVVNVVGVIKQVSTVNSVVPTLLINSIFPHRLAELSRQFGFRLITISTDCVFSGVKGNYSEDDVPDSLDLYGKSKQFGEIDFGNALTLRTSIIGRELDSQNGLIEWMLSNRGGTIRGYTNAIFSGFPTVVLAGIIGELIEEHGTLSGLFHLSSEPIAKLDLLNDYKEAFGLNIDIEPYDDFRIDRSLDSTRFRSATGIEIPNWPELIAAMRSDPTPYDGIRARPL